MLVDPERVIAEVLGEPSTTMKEPVNAGYECPFIDGQCTKRGHGFDVPYPICTVRHGIAKGKPGRPITICPNRFYEADLLPDIVHHCWPGPAPRNPRAVYEVQMGKFGKVDMVVADVDPQSGAVREFVSVELQAVDLGGSVEPAYQGVINRWPLVDVTYGVNWKNVQKRLIAQLVEKGFYHHQWRNRIIAVIQTPLYEYLHRNIQFDELPPSREGATIQFMLYDYVQHPERPDALQLQLDRVVATSHSSLMSSMLYQEVPDKAEFCRKIENQLGMRP